MYMNALDSSNTMMQATASADTFPSTEQLLVEGGDARIALNFATGANQYGCRPQADAGIAAFGSATSSTISAAAFFAANQVRTRIAHQLNSNREIDIYADEMNRVRREFIELCGLKNIPGLDLVFAASGTDSHLMAAQLVGGMAASPLRILIVDPAETGSGVPAALSGRHFSSRSALGEAITQGAKIVQGHHADVVAIPIRLAEGLPRNIADIDADFERQVAVAVAAGQRVLLTMVDVSKTGMIAPSVDCAVRLHQRYPEQLQVLVDACQFRLAPATLQAYLLQGFMVSITGSKFITGPSFAGALLIPAVLAKKLRGVSVVNGLLPYSTRADWPFGWQAAKQLHDVPNFGLLLRWEATLKELRAFHAISNAVTTHFLQTFADAIHQRLANDPVFGELPVPELQRLPFADTQHWDHIQTIFPFLIKHPHNGMPFSSEETAKLYGKLQTANIQLAQPVACGKREGIAISALRLCVSSRLVVEAMQQSGKNEQAVIQRALNTLNEVAKISGRVL